MNNSKTILVTGGSRGIGKSIIEKFSENGFNIITVARNEVDLIDFKEKVLQLNNGINFEYFVGDLSNREQLDLFLKFIRDKKIEILVNNCGKFIPGNVHEEPDGLLEDLINTNLYSTYHISRAVLPQMKERKKGYIFNICSVASLKAYPNGGSYSISKFAMYGLSKALREEMKPYDVKVTAVLPGAVRTSSWDGVVLPDDRFIPPQDIADVIFELYNLDVRTAVEEIIIRPQKGDI